MLFGSKQIAVISHFRDSQSQRWLICFWESVLFVSVVESAAGVVASAKTGAEMIEDSSKYMIISVSRLKLTVVVVYTLYYMASSVSGQDEPNRALWLATRAGKMEPSCPLGTTRCIPQAKFHQKPYNKSFIDQVCSVKMAGYWPRLFFLPVYGPRLCLGP